jgi:hypothetical protein
MRHLTEGLYMRDLMEHVRGDIAQACELSGLSAPGSMTSSKSTP